MANQLLHTVSPRLERNRFAFLRLTSQLFIIIKSIRLWALFAIRCSGSWVKLGRLGGWPANRPVVGVSEHEHGRMGEARAMAKQRSWWSAAATWGNAWRRPGGKRGPVCWWRHGGPSGRSGSPPRATNRWSWTSRSPTRCRNCRRWTLCCSPSRTIPRERRSREAVLIDGLRNVLDAIPALSDRFILISTTGVYGQRDDVWVDERSPCARHRRWRSVLLGGRTIAAWPPLWRSRR